MVPLDGNRWRVMRPGRLRVRRWQDEVVVYDDRTGDTLIFEDLPGRVLERLLLASANLDELLDFVVDAQDERLSGQRRKGKVLDVIARLRRKGLVKPVLL